MVENLDLKKLHNVQYEILLEFDRVCKKYGLTYFLAYGTLLGAVRHNGFIPWDDDVDTLMPYDDYLKLQGVPAEEWKAPFFLQSSKTDKEWDVCFMKVRNSDTTLITDVETQMDVNHGVDIDIYPLIHLADNPKERSKQYRRTMLYMLLRVNEPPRNHGKVLYFGGKVVLLLIPNGLKKKLRDRLESEITQYQSSETKDSYVVGGNIEIMKQKLKSAWFSDSEEHFFEGRKFPIPIGANEWMTLRYGEKYMQMPPEELRGIKLDHFVIVDLENSYKKYKGKYYCTKTKEKRKIKNDRWVNYS